MTIWFLSFLSSHLFFFLEGVATKCNTMLNRNSASVFLVPLLLSWCLLCQFKDDPSNLFQITRSFFHVHCWILLNPVYIKIIPWCLSLICENFKYSNGFCIPRINLTWLQYVIITMYHWIHFANSFPCIFMKETGLLFFFLLASMWGFDRKATLVPQNEFGHLFSFSTP